MATTTHHSAIATRPALADRFAALLQNLRARHEENKLVRRTERELSALNDRDLADLGISRFDIPRIARDSVRSL